MPTILLDKPFDEAAESVLKHVKNGTLTRETDDTGIEICVVEGDFQIFSITDMDTWGGHLKFVFRDTEAKDEEEIASRGQIAMLAPDLAHLMTAKAQMNVYRQREVVTTIIRTVGHREISRQTSTEMEWEDVTTEFGKMSEREVAWMDR